MRLPALGSEPTVGMVCIWSNGVLNMKVVDSMGRRISSLDQWGRKIFDGTSKAKDWQKDHSAYSLAEFIMGQRDGASYLERRLSSVLSRLVTLDQAVPEYLARFDSYPGNPSNLDLGITGSVGRLVRKRSLFVGLEAKVNETFGSTVGSRYSSAMRTRNAGKKTNAPERVEGLLSEYFGVKESLDSSPFGSIRYQLLTGTVGTVARPQEVPVFYVLVFRTSLYDERRGTANQRDYGRFIEACEGRPLMRDGRDFRSDELTVGGKRLVCVYDYVDI